jgi:GGDEF domain-containing protein
MSGIDILKRMRADERMKTIPVVVITAYPPYADSLPVEPDLLLLKPVDINQLSNLVQRLQVTQGAISEPSSDKDTGLYTRSFFTVRMTFSLERIKQSEFRRFGILFVEISGIPRLKEQLNQKELTSFSRRLADKFKTTLRPTDTMTWSLNDGLFLTLIEDIPGPEAPLRISQRVRDSMKDFLLENDNGIEMRTHIGFLICDSDYEDTGKIMDDLDHARSLLRERKYSSPAVFDRQMLAGGRIAE